MTTDETKYKRYKYIFLLSTFAGVAGLYIAYKFHSETAQYVSYALFAIWLILAVFVRVSIIKDKKNHIKK